MKKNTIISVLIALSLSSLNAIARDRSIIEMKQIAAKTMNARKMINVDDIKIANETRNLAVFTSNNGGTVIVSKNDEREAVIGYSDSKYDPENLPCGFQWWLKAMEASLRSTRNNLPSKATIPMGLPNSVQPLVPYTWNQDSPYNSMCPNGSKVGCVAVAMGQVIASHNFPSQGQSSNSYYSNGTLLSVDFGSTTYDWNAIRSGNTSEIAKLLYHCGVATNMEYGSGISTTYTYLVRNAVVNYFRYKSDAVFVSRSNFTDSQWINLLFSNLAQGNAVVYRGTEDSAAGSSGHSFVIDGYDSSGNVHVNWGWGGMMDGYFDLATMQTQFSGSYSYNHQMVCNIIPGEQQKPDEDNLFLIYDLGDKGTVKLVAEPGSSYCVKVVPNSGYSLQTVTFNDNNILQQVANNNSFITPAITSNSTLRVRTTSSASDDGHDYVDLQLPSGKLWATTNYGASTASGYGTYVEWGSNDIVSANWGGEWYTPTVDDVKELINNCHWTWSVVNGVKGYTVKGNNGNTIFLPAAGMKMGSTMKVGEWVYYWSSTAESSNMTYILMATQSSVGYGSQNTMASLPIRPIRNGNQPTLATSITLNYNQLQLTEGQSTTLIATVLPQQASNQTLSWISSNTNVATVDYNGKVTAKGIGTANITATTTDGSNLYASCKVTVASSGQSTTGTVQVGYGTVRSETLPICNWWLGTYCGFESIYTKEELGLNVGDQITSFAFYCASNSGKGGKFNVRIKETNLNVFQEPETATDNHALMTTNDEVYGRITLGSYSGGNWIVFNLDKPYVYNGKNLVIDIRNSEPGTRSGNCYFSCSNVEDKTFCWFEAKNEEASSFYNYDTTSGFHLEDVRPNVRISYTRRATIPGDVNGDDVCNSADVTALYQFILNNDASKVVNGDQNGDGIVNSADVTAVYKIILGL